MQILLSNMIYKPLDGFLVNIFDIIEISNISHPEKGNKTI